MSTNYYLINKFDEGIKYSLYETIITQLGKLKDKLLEFNNIYELDIGKEIEDKISMVENDLDYGIFKAEEIHICKTNRDTLTWQVNEHFKNEKEFIDFYYKNKDDYYIESEGWEVFILDEFIEKIHWSGQVVKYLNCEFM